MKLTKKIKLPAAWLGCFLKKLWGDRKIIRNKKGKNNETS